MLTLKSPQAINIMASMLSQTDCDGALGGRYKQTTARDGCKEPQATETHRNSAPEEVTPHFSKEEGR